MGEVYRATDTKLGGDIALKVLPADMALDAERRGVLPRSESPGATRSSGHCHDPLGGRTDGVHFLTMNSSKASLSTA